MNEELQSTNDELEDGKPFFGLDMGLPVEQVRGPVKAALGESDRRTVTLDAIDRRGRAFTCTVRSLPLVEDGSASYGVILLMWRDDGEMGNIAGHV